MKPLPAICRLGRIFIANKVDVKSRRFGKQAIRPLYPLQEFQGPGYLMTSPYPFRYCCFSLCYRLTLVHQSQQR